MTKQNFIQKFRIFLDILQEKICLDSSWKIKGFIDVDKKIFSLSNDTKVISKILEIHIFPYILDFAKHNNFDIILPNHQNYYPDLSFVFKQDSKIKFAIDLKPPIAIKIILPFAMVLRLAHTENILKTENQTKTYNFLIKNI